MVCGLTLGMMMCPALKESDGLRSSLGEHTFPEIQRYVDEIVMQASASALF